MTAVPQKNKDGRFDLQDALLVAVFIALESGVAAFCWPAALIFGGAVCRSSAYLMGHRGAKGARA